MKSYFNAVLLVSTNAGFTSTP